MLSATDCDTITAMVTAARQKAVVIAGLAVCLFTPVRAQAQVYLTSFTGTNFTRPATVTIDQPALNRTLHFADVEFAGEPLQSPQYYGARLGLLFGGQRLGVELEFLHQKVISQTDRVVQVTGVQDGLPVDVSMRMDEIVQHFAMTHGLNFWMMNLVWRQPIGTAKGAHAASLVVRGGAGPVTPGVDAIVGRKSVQNYQYAGLGAGASAGLDVPLWKLISLNAEYKFTFAKPKIDIDRGTGQTTTMAHHVAAGIAIGFARPR